MTQSSFDLHPALNTHYQLHGKLGEGVSGKVYSGIRVHDGLKVAVKCVIRSKIPANRLALDKRNEKTIIVPMEVYILRRLDHPSIIRLVDYFQDSRYYYIITELAGDVWISDGDSKETSSSRDLFECIERGNLNNKQNALKIFKQLVNVLVYLKSMNVYHMDIKDENIVISRDFNIKLIDFGSAHILLPEHDRMQSFYGTPEYAPPEIVRGKAYLPEEADVWALGTLLHIIVYGKQPFRKPADACCGLQRLEGGEWYCELINEMLSVNANKRPKLTEIMERLSTM